MATVDWLHTMDQGVLADIIGNVLWDALSLMGVRSRAAQVNVLWAMVTAHYAEAKNYTGVLRHVVVLYIEKRFLGDRC